MHRQYSVQSFFFFCSGAHVLQLLDLSIHDTLQPEFVLSMFVVRGGLGWGGSKEGIAPPAPYEIKLPPPLLRIFLLI